MLEVPEDFVYNITPTPYGMSLSVTIEKPNRDENEDFLLRWALDDDFCIDEDHF